MVPPTWSKLLIRGYKLGQSDKGGHGEGGYVCGWLNYGHDSSSTPCLEYEKASPDKIGKNSL